MICVKVVTQMNKKYKIIYADPPWSYDDKMSGHSFSLDHEYETQGLEWIKSLPVGSIADKDCVLFLWAVSPLMPEALQVIESWGFKYKTIGFVWSKKYANGEPVSNLGRWTMGNVELCLLATKGKPQRVTKNIKQLVEDYRAEHSRKPDSIRERIVELMGDLPRIELFARDDNQPTLTGKSIFDGWDVFGNETKNSIELPPLQVKL